MLHKLTMSDTPNQPQEENQKTHETPSGEKKFRLGVPRLKKPGAPAPFGKSKLPSWSSRNGLWTWILFGVAIILLVSVYSRPDFASKELPYSDFKAKLRSGEIKKVVLSPNLIKGFTEEVPEKPGKLFQYQVIPSGFSIFFIIFTIYE